MKTHINRPVIHSSVTHITGVFREGKKKKHKVYMKVRKKTTTGLHEGETKKHKFT